MSKYPVSSKAKRYCWQYLISGAHIPRGESCPIYPCIHTPCQDLDWLADREDSLAREDYHILVGVCFRNPKVFKELKPLLTAEKFSSISRGVERKRRLQKKRDKIQHDSEEHNKMRADERERYFAYWDSFTMEQLIEFKKDPEFRRRYDKYMSDKAFWIESE